ncbi:MAG: circadian clock protein KaiA [Cyanobacteria bacterium P01_C01_bin.89]
MSKPSTEPSPKLILAAFVDSQEDEILLQQGLSQEQATLSTFRNVSEFIDYLEDQRHELDGIILKVGSFLPSLVAQLYQRAILLPAVILSPQSSRHGATPELESNATSSPDLSAPTACHYHQAEVQLNSHQEWKELPLEEHLQRAISDFLKLHTKSSTATKSQLANGNEDHHQLLMTQQRRLADKLQGRLGYLEVYYKREQSNFLRNLEPIEQEQLVSALREEYRTIVLSYFDDDADTNTKVDSLVDTAFFADISVAKVVEINMWLMDEFSKQLKLEGRSPEILLDYRLTLIDVIAHLCEMYRRSVPRKS